MTASSRASAIATSGRMTYRLMGSPGGVARAVAPTVRNREAPEGNSSGLTPDGDVAGAVGGELRAVPPGHPAFELEAGQLRHQVALGRPHVAEVVHPVTRRPVGVEPVMVRGALLVDDVVGVEAEV